MFAKRKRAVAAALGLCLAAWAAAVTPAKPSDPLAAELSRWSSYLATHTATDETWQQVKEAAGPVLDAATKALADGRRLLALQRFAAARMLLSASAYVGEHTGPESKDEAAFEAEWERMGRELRTDLGETSPSAFESVRPAGVRALAEASQPQVRIYYDASLEFARSTMPDAGLFYIGEARAQREFVAFARTLSLPASEKAGRAPKLRALGPDLDDLEARLLSAYRPPAAIDRHAEFISASSALKEARELDAAGLRYGALARYLQALLRAAPLLPPSPSPPMEREALVAKLDGFARRLSAGGIDHSVGRIFLESAQMDLAGNAPPANAAAAPQARFPNAEAIVAEVLPRYFAALEPAPRRVRPEPGVTVTLVRWPYT